MIMFKELVDNVQWAENNMHMIAMTTESHFLFISIYNKHDWNTLPYFIS